MLGDHAEDVKKKARAAGVECHQAPAIMQKTSKDSSLLVKQVSFKVFSTP